MLPEWKHAEYVLSKRNDYPSFFLCRNHKRLLSKVNRVVTNTYFNNEQKKLQDTVQKDNIKGLKQRQTKSLSWSPLIIILLLNHCDPMLPFVSRDAEMDLGPLKYLRWNSLWQLLTGESRWLLSQWVPS